MGKQTVNCRTCGKPYEVESDCATDQSICPPCRWKEKSPKGERKPLDFSRLKGKFRIGALS